MSLLVASKNMAGGVGIVSLTAGGIGYATDRGYPAGLSTVICNL